MTAVRTTRSITELKSSMISLIAAMGENRVIGRDNDLPWHLPTDFAYFKRKTLGKPCLIARKTFESFGGALRGRLNIVLTHQDDYRADDAVVVHTIDEGLDVARKECGNEGEIMICGGATLYEKTLPICDRLYLTRIHGSFEGDTFFPEFDEHEWVETWREEHTADEKNSHDFTFILYERKK